MVTLLETGEKITFLSVNAAAKEMGALSTTIGNLASKRTKKSKSNGGAYANHFFTARFRD